MDLETPRSTCDVDAISAERYFAQQRKDLAHHGDAGSPHLHQHPHPRSFADYEHEMYTVRAPSSPVLPHQHHQHQHHHHHHHHHIDHSNQRNMLQPQQQAADGQYMLPARVVTTTTSHREAAPQLVLTHAHVSPAQQQAASHQQMTSPQKPIQSTSIPSNPSTPTHKQTASTQPASYSHNGTPHKQAPIIMQTLSTSHSHSPRHVTPSKFDPATSRLQHMTPTTASVSSLLTSPGPGPSSGQLISHQRCGVGIAFKVSMRVYVCIYIIMRPNISLLYICLCDSFVFLDSSYLC